jgi:50S ribosomal subunit-associated GTPase HflX
VLTSVKTGEGLDELLSLIELRLTESDPAIRLRVPDSEYALVALLHREATILEEGRDEEATLLRCRVPERLASKFEKYRV